MVPSAPGAGSKIGLGRGEGELRSGHLGWRGCVGARAVPALLSLQVVSSLQQLDPGRGGTGALLLVGAAWRGRSGDGAVGVARAGCGGARGRGQP